MFAKKLTSVSRTAAMSIINKSLFSSVVSKKVIYNY